MFGIVHEQIADNQYRVNVYSVWDKPDEHVWGSAEIHAKVAEGLYIVGVSDDGIVTYDSINDCVQVEKVKLQLFNTGWADCVSFKVVANEQAVYCEMCIDKAFDVEELVVPEFVGALSVGKGANAHIGSLVMPDSVEFVSCLSDLSVQSVRFPETIDHIPNECFKGSAVLQSVVLPKEISAIQDSAFENCKGLTEITLPDVVCEIGVQSFAGCTGLQTIRFGADTEHIQFRAFQKCGISELSLPQSIKSLWGYAFEGCTKLKHVQMYSYDKPYEQPKTDDCYFEKLAKKVVDNRYSLVTTASPFVRCTKLTDVEILGDGKYLQPYQFCGCKSLRWVVLPDSIVELPEFVFCECAKLQPMHLPANLQVIDEFAMEHSVLPLEIPSGVTEIRRSAFAECGGSAEYVLPDGLQYIGSEAFAGSGLVGITIPASVERMEYRVFHQCQKLETIVFENFIERSGMMFFGCGVLKSVQYVGGLRHIGDKSFELCPSLKELDLPNTVEQVDKLAFYGSSIERIIVHSEKVYCALYEHGALTDAAVEVIKDYS